MITLIVPKWVRKYLSSSKSEFDADGNLFQKIRARVKENFTLDPEVSVLIPAWNEEKNIAGTIHSLVYQKTNSKYELIVIDNNSTDKTKLIAKACGIKVVPEYHQGVSFARQLGLINARGKYILCADSDTIYPERWIEKMTCALKDEKVSCVYATYSLIPPKGKLRIGLAFYEFLSSILFKLRRKYRPYLNVMGFNFGFKRLDVVALGGFNLKRKIWEDGWMALRLMEFGRIIAIDSKEAKVWTSARRLMADGSIKKAFIKRIKKEITRIGEYLTKVPIKKEISFN